MKNIYAKTRISFSYLLVAVFILASVLFMLPPLTSSFAPTTISAAGWQTKYNIQWYSEKIGSYTYYYTYLGYYPQSYVGDVLNDDYYYKYMDGQLDEYATGNTYTAGANQYQVWTEYEDPYLSGYRIVGGYESQVGAGLTYRDGSTVTQGVSGEGPMKFFYVEPIKWWCMTSGKPSNTLVPLISDLCLTSGVSFDSSRSTYLYSVSGIRSFANNIFYLDAFVQNNAARNYFVQTTVKNNVLNDWATSTSDGKGTTTYDYVWLPSYYELTSKYVGSSYYYLQNSRAASPSDFALANMCTVDTSTTTSYRTGTAPYYTRTVRDTGKILGNTVYYMWQVDANGSLTAVSRGILDGNLTNTGFRPCITVDNSYKTFDEGISSYPGIHKESDGYHITDRTGLVAMSDYSTAVDDLLCFDDMTFYLDNDIYWPTEEIFPAIKHFNGILDGQGHSIFNLVCYMNAPEYGGPLADELYSSSSACFIWSVFDTAAFYNINFYGLILGGACPGALIGGNVFSRNSDFSQIIFSNVHVEVVWNDCYPPHGVLVMDASHSQMLIVSSSIVDDTYEPYGMSTTPEIKAYGAIAGNTAYANITFAISYYIGHNTIMFNDINGPTIADCQCSYFFASEYLFEGINEPNDDITCIKKFWWDSSASSLPTDLFTYYDTTNFGLPYHYKVINMNSAKSSTTPNYIRTWIPANSKVTINDIPTRLLALQFELQS